MKYRKLGNTDIDVSVICLGTMTWGEQNTEAEGHEQLDYAMSRDINFIDTAELYSVPSRPETYGSTETIIGTWLKKRGRRDDLVLASKIGGPGDFTKHMRGGNNYGEKHMRQAIEGSLKRLQTDYVDLYQLHWPERPTNFFGELGYRHQSAETGVPFEEVLGTMKALIEEGKIRYVGLSNETPWGLHSFLKAAEMHDLPRVVSVQNPYSLLNRTYEIGLSEMSIREECGLLAYSPLAGGLLSGKYIGDSRPEGARYSLFPNFMTRYLKPNCAEAVEEYARVAQEHGLFLAQMSLAFVNDRDFVTSNIIGATSLDQLKENIDSIDLMLTDEVLEKIEAVHIKYPNPGP